MTRETSIEAYQEIEADGSLSDKRLRAYYFVVHNPHRTAGELLKHYQKHYSDLLSRNDLASLLSYLRRIGVIAESGTRECSVSGKSNIIWISTEKKPMKLEKNIHEEVIKINKSLKKLELRKEKLLTQLSAEIRL